MDVFTIKTINDLAFEGHKESELIAGIRQTDAFIPELSLVAEWEGEIAGHVLFSHISIEDETESFPSLALAPVAVHPDHQLKGIGSNLIREGINRAKKLGHSSVVVLGHPEYYPTFGFIPAEQKGIVAPFEVPSEAFMVLELVPNALDLVKGKVKYSDPFNI
ncbi:N-acetyltransferase [Bacillus sp. BHET2]|uniref:GNAT family N-acetyltransferase n=1 Tax=Bacillus sp. BHET2 TaxID=2583818 RepID=UPI0023EF5690|nr:N-acetyltransferase [Bacillus sp. BHET2]